MGFKRFSFQLYYRTFLLLCNLVLLAWFIPNQPYILLPIAMGLLAVTQVVGITQLITKHNKKIAKFIFALKHADYNSNFLESQTDSGYTELNQAFQLINDRLRENRLENESYLHFLNAIVEQIKIGLITLNEKGEVGMMNQSANRLLDLPNLQRWYRFEEKIPAFTKAIDQLQEQEKILLNLENSKMNRQLAIHVNTVNLLDEKHKIITFYDIRNELERKEIDSYNKLISILTHEIMNSVTPLSSLTDTISNILQSDTGEVLDKEQLTQEDLEDVAASINTIQKRSKGMLSFIQDYRKIAKIPEPSMQEVHVSGFFAHIATLMQPEFEQRKLQLQLDVKPGPLKIYFDQGLVEQVLINLLINAIHASGTGTDKSIYLKAYTNEGFKIIEVMDEGHGIPDNLKDKIFVPFFSTKDAGSGIGLSLSQQIMQKHGGSIAVESSEGNGASVLLKFRF